MSRDERGQLRRKNNISGAHGTTRPSTFLSYNFLIFLKEFRKSMMMMTVLGPHVWISALMRTRHERGVIRSLRSTQKFVLFSPSKCWKKVNGRKSSTGLIFLAMNWRQKRPKGMMPNQKLRWHVSQEGPPPKSNNNHQTKKKRWIVCSLSPSTIIANVKHLQEKSNDSEPNRLCVSSCYPSGGLSSPR